MRIDCAPLEGVTGRFFRLAHNRWFGGIDQYYAPFLSPTQTHCFGKKELAQVLPENNEGIHLIPQLLARNAEDFLWAAGELAAMGHKEVNLNLGCPSGTVVAKGKGSGFLARFEELEVFLVEVFSRCPIEVSIKTRLGLIDPEEFGPLLELFNRFPIKELTIHPRVQKDMYKHPVRREVFAASVFRCTLPLCYNGDLNTTADCTAVQQEYPELAGIMLGRGLIGDPALARKVKGGTAADVETLQAFHDELYESYCQSFQSRRNAMMRMKELWFYLIGLFEDDGKQGKALRKATDHKEFEEQAAHIFRTIPLKSENTAPKS